MTSCIDIVHTGIYVIHAILHNIAPISCHAYRSRVSVRNLYIPVSDIAGEAWRSWEMRHSKFFYPNLHPRYIRKRKACGVSLHLASCTPTNLGLTQSMSRSINSTLTTHRNEWLKYDPLRSETSFDRLRRLISRNSCMLELCIRNAFYPPCLGAIAAQRSLRNRRWI